MYGQSVPQGVQRWRLISELTIFFTGQITSCLWPQFLPFVNGENSWSALAPVGSDEVLANSPKI